MSIIQEALKRKEEEERQPGGESVQTPPMPPPSPPPKQPKKRGPWVALAAVAVFVVVAVGAGYYLLQTGVKGLMQKSAEKLEQPQNAQESEQPAEAEGGAPSAMPEPENLISKVQASVGAADKRVAAEAEPAAAAAEQDDAAGQVAAKTEAAETSPPAVQSKPVQPPAGTDSKPAPSKTEPVAETGAVPVGGEAASAPPAGARTKAEWPRIEVKGILAPGPNHAGTVLIGSEMRSEGDVYRDVHINKVGADKVLLEFRGERRVLRSGQSTGTE